MTSFACIGTPRSSRGSMITVVLQCSFEGSPLLKGKGGFFFEVFLAKDAWGLSSNACI